MDLGDEDNGLLLADLAEGEHLPLAEEVEHGDVPHLAPRLTVLTEGNVLQAVEEPVGDARVRAGREGEVTVLHDLFSDRRRGDDDGGDPTKAEEHNGAVLLSERLQGAVGFEVELMEVADEREARRRWGLVGR